MCPPPRDVHILIRGKGSLWIYFLCSERGLADTIKLRIWGEIAPGYLGGSNVMSGRLSQRRFRDRRESFNKPPVPEPHPRPSESGDLGMGPRPGSGTTALKDSLWAEGAMKVVGDRQTDDRLYTDSSVSVS